MKPNNQHHNNSPIEMKSLSQIAKEIDNQFSRKMDYVFTYQPFSRPKFVCRKLWNSPLEINGFYTFIGTSAVGDFKEEIPNSGISLRGEYLYVGEESESEALKTMEMLNIAKNS